MASKFGGFGSLSLQPSTLVFSVHLSVCNRQIKICQISYTHIYMYCYVHVCMTIPYCVTELKIFFNTMSVWDQTKDDCQYHVAGNFTRRNFLPISPSGLVDESFVLRFFVLC